MNQSSDSLESIVDNIIADGVIDKDEYEHLVQQIYKDRFVDEFELDQLKRISRMKQEGKLKIYSESKYIPPKEKLHMGRIFLIALLVLIIVISSYSLLRSINLPQLRESIKIVVIGPFFGENADQGRVILEAVQLAVIEKNALGGIGENQIEVIRIDNHDQVEADTKLLEILANIPRVQLIIGQQSQASALIGQERKIPMITPTATLTSTAQDNHWYFHTGIDNKLQAEFAAVYISNIFEFKTVTIVHDADPSSRDLATRFQNRWENHLILETQNVWSFDSTAENVFDDLESIAAQLDLVKNPGIIFIAAGPEVSAKLLQIIKEVGITSPVVGGDSMVTSKFLRAVKAITGQYNLDFYLNGVYAMTDFTPEIASKKVDEFYNLFHNAYKKHPSLKHAAYYDSVSLGLEAMEFAHSKGGNLSKKRVLIRDYLSNINKISKSYVGATGPLYFDQHGGANRPIYMVTYNEEKILPSMVQLKPMDDLNLIPQLKQALLNKQVFIDVPYDYKVIKLYKKINVVYTGIELLEVKNFDPIHRTYDLKFNIWFRFYGDAPVYDITFLNVTEALSQKKIVEKVQTPIQTYRRYYVEGKFRADYNFNPLKPLQHDIGISFRHKKFTKDEMIFIPDFLGMQSTDESSLTERLNGSNAFSLLRRKNWELKEAGFYQDVLSVSSFGHPTQLGTRGSFLNYSRFNLKLTIQKKGFTIQKYLPYAVAYFFLWGSLIFFGIYQILVL
ncbi:MAG: hypothetical protein COB67_11065, partial [SAR324 cluster bacterium]